MSKKQAKDRDATRLRQHLIERKAIFMNRFVGVDVISKCDTSLYVLSLIKQVGYRNESRVIPCAVVEGDMCYVNMANLRKHSYDRALLRRCMRLMPNVLAQKEQSIYVLAEYGATGIVMGLTASRGKYAWQDDAPDRTEPQPAWYLDTQTLLSYEPAGTTPAGISS